MIEQAGEESKSPEAVNSRRRGRRSTVIGPTENAFAWFREEGTFAVIGHVAVNFAVDAVTGVEHLNLA
ncbi:hypothetical protein TNCV_1103831 [Trichonephila clavipes]|nr:hypothetical protein TNCV_1103831 [Trichonephila clavipes]